MDITARKYKFIEEFMRVISLEKIDKLELLEDVLYADSEDNEVVSLTEEQIQILDEIRSRHISGESSSISLDELRGKFKDKYGIQS